VNFLNNSGLYHGFMEAAVVISYFTASYNCRLAIEAITVKAPGNIRPVEGGATPDPVLFFDPQIAAFLLWVRYTDPWDPQNQRNPLVVNDHGTG
jgi:hypothetical protein